MVKFTEANIEIVLFFCLLVEGHIFTSKLIFASSLCMCFCFLISSSNVSHENEKDRNVTTDFINWFFSHMVLIFLIYVLWKQTHSSTQTHSRIFLLQSFWHKILVQFFITSYLCQQGRVFTWKKKYNAKFGISHIKCKNIDHPTLFCKI